MRTAGVSWLDELTRVEGRVLELGEGLILDGDRVPEGAVHVVVVSLSLLVLNLRLEPVRRQRGDDL